MCNSRPVLRVGQTLDIAISSTTSAREAIPQRWLRADHAAPIAYAAYERVGTMADLVASAIAANDATSATENRNFERGLGRFTNDRGLILDLPNLVFDTAHFRHRIGLSLTVCMPNTRSKIWFRSQCIDVMTDGKAKPPVDLSFPTMEKFFDEASILAERALEQLRMEYDSVVKKYLLAKDQTTQVELSFSKEFRFKVFDSNRPDLTVLFKELESGASFTGCLEKRLAEGGAVPHPALLAARLSLEEELGEQEAIYAIRNAGDGYKIIGQRNRVNDTGIFIYRGTHAEETNSVTYSGVTFDSASEDKDRNPTSSPALRMTAEMLAGLVRDQDVNAA